MKSSDELIGIVLDAAAELNIDLMLIGAFSRDYWRDRFQIKAPVRTTGDIDFACQVVAWRDYQRLFDTLEIKYRLRPDTRKIHTLWLRDELAVDLVPFGGIADREGKISWPPDHHRQLCVLGYDAAKHDAEVIAIGGRSLNVIKPYWLALLKLQAYSGDLSREKDLVDFYFLVDNYFDCIDEDLRLYGENAIDADLMNADDFDLRVAAAALIARDCRRSAPATAASVLKNLADFQAKHPWNIALAAAVPRLGPDMAARILSAIFEPQAGDLA